VNESSGHGLLLYQNSIVGKGGGPCSSVRIERCHYTKWLGLIFIKVLVV